MTGRTKTRRSFAGMGIMILALVLGYLVIRPWHLRWGATDEDLSRTMPGDLEHIGWTRAITIAATPEEIWPWLVQWGQGRGGWYSYDWLENLFGFDIHTAESILPEFQDLAVGDAICMAKDFCPSHVTVLEPNRWLGWQAEENGDPVWTFTFGLFPVDDGHTRLVVRESFDNTFMPPAAVAALEVPDVVMELKALHTVRDRAEGKAPQALVPPLEIILWLLAAGTGFGCLLLFTDGSHDRRPLPLMVASVIALLPITFLFPPLWLRALYDLALLSGMLWLVRQPYQAPAHLYEWPPLNCRAVRSARQRQR